ncbi:hypothetical protein [Lysinibacillus sp. 54212]|uniref:hypothetical protein n=1 Tax=Lysinibacillus sp. 54212 TaxID=3119829 RepID=UPI002FC667BB
MAFTSFNPTQIQTQNVQMNQPLTLREGQVFHGTIKQLYPDQMAEIQVGNHKLVAKLEAPLKVGDAHFFQVTNTGAQTELKVASSPMGQAMTPAQQMTQLLESMNLPKSTEMQQVLGHFMKEQIPITREQLIRAEQWLKNLPQDVPKQVALAAMQRMVELKMPFTNEVFQALVQGSKTDGLSTTLQNFMNQLANTTTINSELKTNLMQQLSTIAKPLNAEIGGLLLSRSMQVLMDSNAAVSDKLQALNVLKESGILPKTATLQNWQTQQKIAGNNPTGNQAQGGQLIQQIVGTKPDQTLGLIQNVKDWISNESLLTNNQKMQLQQLVDRFAQLPQSKQTIDVFAKQMQERLIQAFSDNTPSRIFTQNENQLTSKDQLLSLLKSDSTLQQNDALLRALVKVSTESTQPSIRATVVQVEAQVQSAVDSKAMEQAVKTVLKGLGISYEAALSNKAGDVQALAGQLKPQLLSLLQDIQVPTALRESAEMLMARMNGMQILSGDNGHHHQLVMQVPLEFFGKRMDATLQWSGRMKEDGKIDANYARVLFYLNMESLNETVIDMGVQNRIVTINVFNDQPNLNGLAESLKLSLKQGLADKDYQLSGVFIKPFEREKLEKVTQNSKEDTQEHSGVDIRV